MAWPLLFLLTPAADRPWVSGTSDNSIFSLIVGYNGLGRIDGQAGGPQACGGGAGPGGGGAGSVFGGDTGPFRLLDASLGGQAGWLLGFAVVGGIAILVASRLRRADARTGWLIAVGGAFATTAVAFSFAKGIFHPYYVSLLAPFTAALVGAGAGQLRSGDRAARILGPLAVAAGVATTLAVIANTDGAPDWVQQILLPVGVLAAIVLALKIPRRVRVVALAAVLGALLLAPATWAVQTLGHATSGTFPAGGPAAQGFGGPGGAGAAASAAAAASRRRRRRRRAAAGSPPAAPRRGAGARPAARAPGRRGFARAAARPAAGRHPAARAAPGGSAPAAAALRRRQHRPDARRSPTPRPTAAARSPCPASRARRPRSSTSGADVAALGGFSGRESEVSVSWLADAVRAGQDPLGPDRRHRRRRLQPRRPRRQQHRDGGGRADLHAGEHDLVDLHLDERPLRLRRPRGRARGARGAGARRSRGGAGRVPAPPPRP